MPYRILRSAVEAGGVVHAIGGVRAKGLAWSRYCRSFNLAADIFTADDAEAARLINEVVKDRAIDLVLAGDAPATRLLIKLGGRLSAPLFPMPDLGSFDLLNDKNTFSRLMVELGAPCPRFDLHPDAASVRAAWRRGDLRLPAVAKPLSETGSKGVIMITRDNVAEMLDRIDYAPVLVQDFLKGVDVDVSAYCKDGELIEFVAYCLHRGRYFLFDAPSVVAQVRALARHLKVSGILNFDLVANEDFTTFHWLECNPRVFFSIDVLTVAGMNFIGFGLGIDKGKGGAAIRRKSKVSRPSAILMELCRFRPLRLDDWAFSRFLLRDPISYVREALKLEKC